MSVKINKDEVRAAVLRYLQASPRWIDLHELRANVWYAELGLRSTGDQLFAVVQDLLREKLIRGKGGNLHPAWKGTFQVCAATHQLA